MSLQGSHTGRLATFVLLVAGAATACHGGERRSKAPIPWRAVVRAIDLRGQAANWGTLCVSGYRADAWVRVQTKWAGLGHRRKGASAIYAGRVLGDGGTSACSRRVDLYLSWTGKGVLGGYSHWEANGMDFVPAEPISLRCETGRCTLVRSR